MGNGDMKRFAYSIDAKTHHELKYYNKRNINQRFTWDSQKATIISDDWRKAKKNRNGNESEIK